MGAVNLVGSELLWMVSALSCYTDLPHIFIKVERRGFKELERETKELGERLMARWRKVVLPIRGDGKENWRRALAERITINLTKTEIISALAALQTVVDEFSTDPIEMRVLVGADVQEITSLISKLQVYS